MIYIVMWHNAQDIITEYRSCDRPGSCHALPAIYRPSISPDSNWCLRMRRILRYPIPIVTYFHYEVQHGLHFHLAHNLTHSHWKWSIQIFLRFCLRENDLLLRRNLNIVWIFVSYFRYSTVHANDEETPSVVKKLLAE